MRISTSLLAALAALALAASACGGDGSDAVARDPGGSSSQSPSPAEPPAPAVPAGPVRTADLATVMDTGSPELCLGPVAQSYPPQCAGPPLLDWDWADHEGFFDQQGEIRWGTFAVTGTWDGQAFAATEAVPGPLYDPMSPEPEPTPSPATTYAGAELEQIASELAALDGVLGAYGGEGTHGHVLADVFYDDGTLQGWADATYGAGVVLVSSALVDAQ